MVIVSVVTLIIMYMDLHLNAQTAKITEELIEFQAGKLFNQAANSSTKHHLDTKNLRLMMPIL